LTILLRYILTFYLPTTCFGCSYDASSGWQNIQLYTIHNMQLTILFLL